MHLLDLQVLLLGNLGGLCQRILKLNPVVETLSQIRPQLVRLHLQSLVHRSVIAQLHLQLLVARNLLVQLHLQSLVQLLHRRHVDLQFSHFVF